MANVLLIGRSGIVVDEAKAQLQMPAIEVFAGTGIEDARAVLRQTKIDHVIIGAGLDLETRLAIVEQIFRLSETTTVHMKDVASGPEGFLAFARAVLMGLDGGFRRA